MALNTTVTARVESTLTSSLDLATATVPLDLHTRIALASGTGASAADLIFHDTRTLAASGTEDLDLAGVLTSPLGATLTYVEVKVVFIRALAANTNSVRVTRPAANGVPLFVAAGDGIDVQPGAVFLWANPGDGGVTVTAGTGDLITVTNSGAGTGVTYDVVIIGASA
jgi:hypothetical protein